MKQEMENTVTGANNNAIATFVLACFAWLVIGFGLGVYVTHQVNKAKMEQLEEQAMAALGSDSRKWYCIDNMPCVEGDSIEVIVTTQEEENL